MNIPLCIESLFGYLCFKTIKSIKGKHCIYRERELYIHSIISLIKIEDWGVWITLKDLNSPGFTGQLRSQPETDIWKVGASWEAFSVGAQKWGATYVGWTIYFESDLVKGVCKYAETLTELDCKQRQKHLRNCIHHLLTKKSFLYIKK